MTREHLWILITAIYLVMSLITLVMFIKDKRAARENAWRTPEATLLMLSLFGGWPGALVAMKFARHKTRKARFRVGVPLMGGLHLAAWIIVGFAIVNDVISN